MPRKRLNRELSRNLRFKQSLLKSSVAGLPLSARQSVADAFDIGGTRSAKGNDRLRCRSLKDTDSGLGSSRRGQSAVSLRRARSMPRQI